MLAVSFIIWHDIKKCCKSSSLEKYVITDIIYVDDKALPFTSRQQLCKGLPIAQRLMTELGLEMHIGQHLTVTSEDNTPKAITKESKTECIFFPSPGYFNQLAIDSLYSQTTISKTMTTTKGTSEPQSNNCCITPPPKPLKYLWKTVLLRTPRPLNT